MSMTVDAVVSGSEIAVWDDEEMRGFRGRVVKEEPQLLEAIFTFGPEGSRLTTREVVLIKKGEGEENQTLRKIDRVFGGGKYEGEGHIKYEWGDGEGKWSASATGKCKDRSGNEGYIEFKTDSDGRGSVAAGARKEGEINPEKSRTNQGK